MAEKRVLDLTKLGFTQVAIINTSIILIYWLFASFIMPSVMEPSLDMGGVTYIGVDVESFFKNNHILYCIVISLLILINSLCVSRLFLRNFVNIKSRHVGSFLYLLMVVTSDRCMDSIVVHLSIFFMLIGIDYLLSSAKHRLSSVNVFKSGLFISLSSMLFIPAIVAVVVPIVYVFVNIRYNHKEFISYIIGLLTPIFIISYLYWLLDDKLFYFIFNYLGEFVNSMGVVTIDQFDIDYLLRSIMVLVSVMLMVLTFVTYLRSSIKRTKIKKSLIIFASLIVVIAAFAAIFNNANSLLMPLYAAPTALILSLFFNINENIVVSNILFSIFIILSFATMMF